MPTMDQYKEQNYLKMLLIGESGSGKTGALASLAKAGYNLNILDFDSGLDILPEVLDSESLKRINYENCTDKLKSSGGKVMPEGLAKGFEKSMNLLTNWNEKSGASTDLGKPANWGRDTFLVIDSMTHMGKCAMRRAQDLNSRGGELKIWQDEWGVAQNMVEGALALLFSSAFKTNVIVTAHVAYIGGEKGEDGEPDDPRPMVGYPMAPGKALSPRIPSYFNTMLLCKQEASGKHYIYTEPDGLIYVKQPFIMAGLPKRLPLETGLATFVEKALGPRGTKVEPQPNSKQGDTK